MCAEDEKTLPKQYLNSAHYLCSHCGSVTDAMRTCLCASNTQDFKLLDEYPKPIQVELCGYATFVT
jgi:hypothetical protein